VVSSEGGPSRRALLGGAGAAVASALLCSACGASADAGRAMLKHAPPPILALDVQILGVALELERRTVAAYTAGIPLLGRNDAKAAKQFLNEELQHTGQLLALIKAAGGVARPRAASYDIGGPPNGPGVLALLRELELAQISNYLNVIPKLSPGPVRAAVASILANDAQHVSILRLAQGLSAVPSPFVSGSE